MVPQLYLFGSGSVLPVLPTILMSVLAMVHTALRKLLSGDLEPSEMYPNYQDDDLNFDELR